MEIVKAFNSNKMNMNITIKGSFNEPLFRSSDIGAILEISNISSSIKNFDNTEKVIDNIYTLGGNQQVSFLTEKGLYKVLFKSRKPIAEQFQNWICEVVKELRINGTYQLEQQLQQKEQIIQNTIEVLEQKDQIIQSTTEQLEQTKQEFDIKLSKEQKLQKQEFLLQKFKNREPVVYIIKVKEFEDKSYIVKIGESRNFTERFKGHKSDYGNDILLLDCFSVLRSEQFEQFIHGHSKIKPNIYKKLEGHEREKELFLVGKELSYNTILQVINENIKQYNERSEKDYMILEERVAKLTMENEKLTMENELLHLKLKNYQSTQNNSLHTVFDNNITESQNEIIQILSQIENINTIQTTNEQKLENIENILHELTEKTTQPPPQSHAPQQQPVKITTGFGTINQTVGSRLQKINPETLQVIQVYETVNECLKEYNFKIARPSITKAINENTVYHGFRWNFVDREKDPLQTENLEPTRELSKLQNVGYIAQLNAAKTEIINVFLDRKTAALQNGYKEQALDIPVKRGTIYNNHYYILYEKCDNDLRSAFETKNGNKPPILYKNGVGLFDVVKNSLMIEYCCKYDCIKQQPISEKTLKKTLDNEIPYNGHYYRSIGSKIKCL